MMNNNNPLGITDVVLRDEGLARVAWESVVPPRPVAAGGARLGAACKA